MTALANTDLERDLLAALMLTPAALTGLLVDGLRSEHFAGRVNAATFEAMVALTDRGADVDPLALAGELDGDARVEDPRAFISHIAVPPMDAILPSTYARHLRDLHRRRRWQQAARLLNDAAETDSAEKLEEAERLLTRPEDGEQSTWTAEELRKRYRARLTDPAPKAWSWPFSEMNRWTGGGIRRQQMILIGGWTAHGKSILHDQILERLALQGLRVHNYINEMSEAERMDRTMARLSGVPFESIYARKLNDRDRDQLLGDHLGRVRVGITECAGWTAGEIARHIRWNRWDVAGVDIVHEIAHRDERDLAEIAQTLRSTAKSVGCALVACVHLNDNRVTAPQRPVPVLRDVRGSGMLVRGADVVLLVHRQDDEDGIPTDDGVLLAPKIRNGSPAAMKVRFESSSMRFVALQEAAW